MLFQLVDRICNEIDALPLPTPPTEMGQQIIRNAPDAVYGLIQGNKSQGKTLNETQAGDYLAFFAILAIKSLPKSARAMVEKVKDQSLSAAQRCAIASILAYLVQPHDFIADDAPGHYGYLDDTIMVQAGLVTYLDTYPAGLDASNQQMITNVLISLTPQSVRPQIQQAIASLSTTIQLLKLFGPYAESVLQFIVANPLASAVSTAAPIDVSNFGRNYGGGFFGKSGAYVEGNNFVMPGGGGLIDGQVFVP